MYDFLCMYAFFKYVDVNMHVCINIFMHKCMYSCVHIYVSVCVYMYVGMNVYNVPICIYADKAILRGHEAAVVDLTFSPVRSDCLCSIDQGDSFSGSHVIGERLVNKIDLTTSYIHTYIHTYIHNTTTTATTTSVNIERLINKVALTTST